MLELDHCNDNNEKSQDIQKMTKDRINQKNQNFSFTHIRNHSNLTSVLKFLEAIFLLHDFQASARKHSQPPSRKVVRDAHFCTDPASRRPRAR